MSKKRFGETERNCYYTSLVFDNQTQEELGTSKVVKLLNALAEENEQLRNAIQSFLKEADIFSEKATEHDIIAYREIKHFDNKDAYYLACAIAELKKVIDDG